jgi:mono/diheme cytochrome c family protein
MINKTVLIFSLLSLSFVGCSEQPTAEKKTEVTPQQEDASVNGRWYKQSHVELGKPLFKDNCAKCHGSNGQSVFNWKERLVDGSFPPPPLNGSAHSWHHPLSMLLGTIKAGGIARGGKMPAFKDQLSDEEIISVTAYFQNFWSDDIYQAWIQRGGLN